MSVVLEPAAISGKHFSGGSAALRSSIARVGGIRLKQGEIDIAFQFTMALYSSKKKNGMLHMTPLYLILLSALDIALYTIRSYTSKLYADSSHDEPMQATLVFSVVTGLVGFFLTLLFSGGLKSSLSVVTLLCGVSAGMVLFLYNLGCIRAAKTGPYAIQSIVGMFGCVLLPLLFERFLWNVTLSGTQYVGIICVLCSFVFLNLKGSRLDGVQKGYYGWVALLFFSNGIYSVIIAAQRRWVGSGQRSEMVSTVFLSMVLISLVYLLVGCKANLKTAFNLAPKSWCYALASGIALTAAMNLLVVLLGYMSASVLYPVQNSAILVLLILLSAVHLHEKIYKHTIVGIVAALFGIIALSL